MSNESTPAGQCNCKVCTVYLPLVRKLETKLDDEGKKMLSELMLLFENDSTDMSVEVAKFRGDWPGWECMKDFHPSTHRIVKRVNLRSPSCSS